jgi:hypothetical protein
LRSRVRLCAISAFAATLFGVSAGLVLRLRAISALAATLTGVLLLLISCLRMRGGNGGRGGDKPGRWVIRPLGNESTRVGAERDRRIFRKSGCWCSSHADRANCTCFTTSRCSYSEIRRGDSPRLGADHSLMSFMMIFSTG